MNYLLCLLGLVNFLLIIWMCRQMFSYNAARRKYDETMDGIEKEEMKEIMRLKEAGLW